MMGKYEFSTSMTCCSTVFFPTCTYIHISSCVVEHRFNSVTLMGQLPRLVIPENP
jgi:hypothetical protein